MALDGDGAGGEDSGADDDTGSEVSMTDDQVLEILENYKKQNKRYAKITKKTYEAYERVQAELVVAKEKIAALSAQPPVSSPESECESCLAMMADLGELKYKYAQLVDERDAFCANLESTKKDLLAAQAPIVSDVEPCETCPSLQSELESIKKPCEVQVRDLERLSAELEGFHARPTLVERVRFVLRLERSLL